MNIFNCYKEDDIQIISEIGKGTFGQVYFGKIEGNYVAIKKIKHPNLEQATKIWKHEINYLMYCKYCPQILQLFGTGELNSNMIVTELCIYGDFEKYLSLKSKVIHISVKLALLDDVKLGITFLHGKNIIHRDIKPNNIFITKYAFSRERAKLGDFSLAITITNNQLLKGKCGTPNFVAPEVIKNKFYSFPADIYSFGKTCTHIFKYKHTKCNFTLPNWVVSCCNINPDTRPKINEFTIKFRCKYSTNCKYGPLLCYYDHTADIVSIM
jgi:serine/threonine protein kinase